MTDDIQDAPDGMIRIQPEYYESLLADRIRIKAIDQAQLLMRTASWGPYRGQWWMQAPGWRSKIVYGKTVEETIDKWIALTVADQEEN